MLEDIKMTPVKVDFGQNLVPELVKQVVREILSSYVGQSFDSHTDAIFAEISLNISETITDMFMDDFLKQKADELKSDIALKMLKGRKPCVKGILVTADPDPDDPESIKVTFELHKEELLG